MEDDEQIQRLAPQVIYPDILSDVADSFKWTVDELPHLLEQAMPLGPNVDPRRIVVMGSSAGGFLALNLVLGRNPSLPLHNTRMVWDYLRKVAGVVAIYPQTKLNDPFYTHKNPNPFRGPLTGEEQLQLDGFLSSRKVCTNTHAGQAQERNNVCRIPLAQPLNSVLYQDVLTDETSSLIPAVGTAIPVLSTDWVLAERSVCLCWHQSRVYHTGL